MNNKYTLPTAEERLMSFACRTCGVPMPHNHSICDGCDAEREYARIEAGEMIACDSCGEETLPNPCNECRDAEEATADWR
jgi:predicted amidophosphoribosyltransferase